jgi:hypothetical protein
VCQLGVAPSPEPLDFSSESPHSDDIFVRLLAGADFWALDGEEEDALLRLLAGDDDLPVLDACFPGSPRARRPVGDPSRCSVGE